MFNFGAFAGGLATSIQKQQELNLQEEKYQQEITNAQNKLALERDALKNKQDEQIANREAKLQTALTKQEDIMLDTNTNSDQKINSFNNISKIYGIDKAKGIITNPEDGKKYIVDIPLSKIETLNGIQKEIDSNNGNGTYKIDSTGALLERQTADSEWTPIAKGVDSSVYEPKEKPKYEKSWDASKNAYVMTKVEEGSIVKEKPTIYAPTETDKNYASYVSHQKSLGLPIMDRYEFSQESKGGKVDATYQTKFENAYNKIKQDNPDMNEVDLRNAADEQIRSTQSERTSAKIDNMAKALTTKLKVNNITDININEARKDKTNATLLDNYFIEKAKDKFGQTWQDDVKVASQSVSNADKVFDAGSVYAKDIINGKSGVNVVNRLFDNTVGSYINKNLTSEEKLNASKDLASIMNVVRNEQFGAVVPMAEQTNFNDAATNLAKSSPDIVRGTISMLKQQKESIQTSKDVLGTELFTVKFGDKLEKLDDKISKLESSLSSNKPSSEKKPFDVNAAKNKYLIK